MNIIITSYSVIIHVLLMQQILVSVYNYKLLSYCSVNANCKWCYCI